MNEFSVKLDAKSANAGLDSLTAKVESATRPAAQAGAQVFYNEVLVRVPVAAREKKFASGRVIAPGGLKASIYQVFSEDNSSETRATYHISWNHRKAPHGHLVENGTSRAPAHPFIRTSYDAVVKFALEAARAKLIDEAGSK